VAPKEIITGDIPFHELRSGHAVSIAVTQHRRTPAVTELYAEALLSPKASILHGILHRCWRYDPTERAKAHEVAGMVSSSTCIASNSTVILLMRFKDGIPWTGMRMGSMDMQRGLIL
jgi:hypothetical protein